MHLASQKAELLEIAVGNGHASRQMRGRARKLKVLETRSVTRLFETAEPPQFEGSFKHVTLARGPS